MTRRSPLVWLVPIGCLLLAACADPEPAATDPTDGPSASPAVTPSATSVASQSAEPIPVPTRSVYYVGPGPDGPDASEASLYRYDEVERPCDHDGCMILDLLTGTPSDPDYRTLWPAGSFRRVGDPEAGESIVELGPSVPLTQPDGMTEREAELSVQQVVYTLREYYGEDVGVRFVDDSGPVDSVLGVATDGGVAPAAAPLDVLSHLNILSPAQGMAVSGSFAASGLANGFEGSVVCFLKDALGTSAWVEPTTAGWQEDRLFPWDIKVDLAAVAAGTYTFSCSTDDPTGGAEGAGAHSDTRTVVVAPPLEPGHPDPPRPVYYVGATPYGPRLFRYFQANNTGEPDHGTGRVLGLLMGPAEDPDYRTLWPADTFTGMLDTGPDGVTVVAVRNDSVVARPPGMSEAEARLALQQLVWTLGANVGEPVRVRLAVRSTDAADALTTVFGIDVSEPVGQEPETDTMALVNIDYPAEGQVVSDRLTASGLASSFEGTVGWQLRSEDGRVVREYSTQAAGSVDQLWPWETRINVSRLEPGTYTFVAMTDDPTVEPPGPFTDTRTVVIR